MKSLAVTKILVVFTLPVMSIRADVVYDFVGTGATLPPEPVGFQLTVPDFINPPLNGPFVFFSCSQLDFSTNCNPAGTVNFSNQSVLGAFSAQLGFYATDGFGFTFFFPTGAFNTPGVYSAEVQPGFNSGTLIVTQTPEPTTIALAFGSVCLCALVRLRVLRKPKL